MPEARVGDLCVAQVQTADLRKLGEKLEAGVVDGGSCHVQFFKRRQFLEGCKVAAADKCIGQAQAAQVRETREISQARSGNCRVVQAEFAQSGEPAQMLQSGIADLGGVQVELF